MGGGGGGGGCGWGGGGGEVRFATYFFIAGRCPGRVWIRGSMGAIACSVLADVTMTVLFGK